MTQAAFIKRLKVWKARMGLSHWIIHVEFDSLDFNPNQIHARVDPNPDYDVATIRVAVDLDEWPDEQGEYVIVHELTHLVLRGVDEAACSVEDMLGSLAYGPYEARFLHELENSVHRLTETLIACYSKDPT